jgi:hypothetical protein
MTTGYGNRIGHYVIEALVVFLGVMGAFWLNQFSEDRRDRAVERQYIETLHVDIVTDTSEFADILTSTRISIERNETLIEQLSKGNRSDSIGVEIIHAVLAQSYTVPSTSTWEALVNTGDLNLISNYELRMQIASLFGIYDGVVLVGEMLRKYTLETAGPNIFESVNFETGEIVKHGDNRDPLFMNTSAVTLSLLRVYVELLEQTLIERQTTLKLLDLELAK